MDEPYSDWQFRDLVTSLSRSVYGNRHGEILDRLRES